MVKRIIFAFLMTTIALCACNARGTRDAAGGSAGAEGRASTGLPPQPGSDPEVSYAFGMVLGSDLKSTGLAFDYDEFLTGLRDSLESRDGRISQDDAIATIQAAFTAAMKQKAEDNKQKETDFLAENGGKTGITTTSSGLQYEVILQGTGERPGPTDVVEVHYEGTLLDGTKFDSSYDRNETAKFPLNQVIRGWSEGIQLMNIGSTYMFYIPSALGYGEQGAGSVIPPNSLLVFKVELLAIDKGSPEGGTGTPQP